ncbi:MAG: quaternary amine ABC transporter ATP-binding protein [Anaerococcus sp.]
MDNNSVISVKDVSMVFGPEKNKALKLKKKGLSKNEIYKQTKSTVALNKASFDIHSGEIFVIIGLSGSGKSTLVRCLNGLNKPTSGKIEYHGEDIGKFNKKEMINFRRDKISMVFQQFGLMSHRDVISNVEFGLEVKGVSKEERHKKSMEMIEMVGLDGHENESIAKLSGGMKQRVGIARALANDPEVLLMDEPFSALDPLVKKDMQFELLSIQKKLNKTIVFITHDINEAFKLGDRVAIMKDGDIIQIDTPEKMSSNPATDYVKQFIDSADMTKVLTVGNVMILPDSIVGISDSPEIAIKAMRRNNTSSAYVIHNMKLQGVVTIYDTIRAAREHLELKDILIEDINTTTPDTLLTDMIEMATETPYPIAVLDENDNFKGIVSKVHVLTSLL